MTAAVVIQHAERMRSIILSSVAYLAVPYFPHYLVNGTIFGKSCWTQYMSFDFLYTFSPKKFSYQEDFCEILSEMCTDLHVKYQLFLSDIKKFWTFFTGIKSSNIKFHKNPSSRSRVVPSERADRLIDRTKLIVAFRNFANAPKNSAKFNTC